MNGIDRNGVSLQESGHAVNRTAGTTNFVNLDLNNFYASVFKQLLSKRISGTHGDLARFQCDKVGRKRLLLPSGNLDNAETALFELVINIVWGDAGEK